jgi:hypothetical protein
MLDNVWNAFPVHPARYTLLGCLLFSRLLSVHLWQTCRWPALNTLHATAIVSVTDIKEGLFKTFVLLLQLFQRRNIRQKFPRKPLLETETLYQINKTYPISFLEYTHFWKHQVPQVINKIWLILWYPADPCHGAREPPLSCTIFHFTPDHTRNFCSPKIYFYRRMFIYWRLWERQPSQSVSVDVGFPCDEVTVLGDRIKETCVLSSISCLWVFFTESRSGFFVLGKFRTHCALAPVFFHGFPQSLPSKLGILSQNWLQENFLITF